MKKLKYTVLTHVMNNKQMEKLINNFVFHFQKVKCLKF